MEDLDLQLDYWNRTEPYKPCSHPVNVERLTVIVAPDSRILDYDCGYGRAWGILGAHGFTYLTGLDPSLRWLLPHARSSRR